MVTDRLNALRTKADISCTEWSNLSTVPEGTIRKILSGETPDPRFDTVMKLVTSVGGSMDDIVGAKKESEIEGNAVITLKEVYESRINSLLERVEALRERNDDTKKYAESLYRDKKMLTAAVVVLVAILIGILLFDIAVGSHGWVQY